jgi:threonine dehydratase
MRALVDDLVLVPDSALIDMMRLSADTLGILLEPSGAAGLAAIATHDLPGERLATVLTGSNHTPSCSPRCSQATDLDSTLLVRGVLPLRWGRGPTRGRRRRTYPTPDAGMLRVQVPLL